MKSLVLDMRSLDPERSLIYRAKSHRYSIAPVVEDRKLLEFENKNKVELPISYRTYL